MVWLEKGSREKINFLDRAQSPEDRHFHFFKKDSQNNLAVALKTQHVTTI